MTNSEDTGLLSLLVGCVVFPVERRLLLSPVVRPVGDAEGDPGPSLGYPGPGLAGRVELDHLRRNLLVRGEAQEVLQVLDVLELIICHEADVWEHVGTIYTIYLYGQLERFNF